MELGKEGTHGSTTIRGPQVHAQTALVLLRIEITDLLHGS